VHATSVAVAGRALLIRGAAGAGKSALAIEMIALGARLVADDRTVLEASGGAVVAAPAPAIAGLIEARGLGLIRLPHISGIPVAAVVDLDETETARLPPRRETFLLDTPVALYRRPAGSHFASAMLLALSGDLSDPEAQT
jgi:HPr kinase/phosphorylase